MALLHTLSYYVANASLLLFALFRFKRHYIPEALSTWYSVTLGIKCLATLAVGLIFRYAFPYLTDPEALFAASVKLYELLRQHPHSLLEIFVHDRIANLPYAEIPRAFFLLKCLTLLNFMTGSSYWLNSLWLSTLSFFCTWLLCLQIRRFSASAFFPSILCFLLVPSTVFWSSGILKESLGFGMLCLLITFWLRALQHPSFPFKECIGSIFPCYVLFHVRFYILGAFALVAVPYYVATKLFPIKGISSIPFQRPFAFCILFVLSWLGMNWICHLIYGVGTLELVYFTHRTFVEWEMANFTFEDLQPTWLSILSTLPQALWHGLFTPQLWEATSFWAFLEGVQNSLSLLLLSIASILWIRHPTRPSFLGSALLLYVFVSAAFISLSAPNFGSLARYKLAYMPFLNFMCILYLFNHFKLRPTRYANPRFLAYFRRPN